MNKEFFILLTAMVITTYLVRMLPFSFFSKKIENRFIKDFLYYIPYSVLGAMTVPYIFYAGGSLWSSLAGFGAALMMAFFNRSLLSVAAVSCLVAYIVSII